MNLWIEWKQKTKNKKNKTKKRSQHDIQLISAKKTNVLEWLTYQQVTEGMNT